MERLNPMPLVDPVHRFVLFTNAKCGGTTLKAWFFENLDFAALHRRPALLLSAWGLRYFAAHLRRGQRLARAVAAVGRQAPGSEDYKGELRRFIQFYRGNFCGPTMRAGPPEYYRRICVVRHPARRLVSAYLDKFCAPEAEPFVDRIRQTMGMSHPSFRQFLDYLEAVDEAVCNPHWRRQTYILDGQRIDDFVRLEAMHDEMARLGNVVGTARLPVLEGKLQTTRASRETGGAPEDLTDTPSDVIAAMRQASGRFPPAASFLTQKTERRIRSLHAADFDRLPYD